MVEGYLLMVIG